MAASWLVAGAILITLAVAVVRYLAAGGPGASSGSSMTTMHMTSALYRGGSALDNQLHRPLLGAAFFTAWQLDAVALAILVILAAGYLTAASLVPLRSDGQRWPLPRTLAFFGGLAVLRLRHQRQHRGL